MMDNHVVIQGNSKGAVGFHSRRRKVESVLINPEASTVVKFVGTRNPDRCGIAWELFGTGGLV